MNLSAHQMGRGNQNGADQQGDDDCREFSLVGGNVRRDERRQHQGKDEGLQDHQKDTGNPQHHTGGLATTLFNLVQVVSAFVIEGRVFVHPLVKAEVLGTQLALGLVPGGSAAFFTIFDLRTARCTSNETEHGKGAGDVEQEILDLIPPVHDDDDQGHQPQQRPDDVAIGRQSCR